MSYYTTHMPATSRGGGGGGGATHYDYVYCIKVTGILLDLVNIPWTGHY